MSSSSDPLIATIEAYEAHAALFADRSRDRAPLSHLHARFTGLTAAGATVLDLGCGPGHDAAVLADRGFHVAGCDATRGLLLEARHHSSIAGRLVLGDARSAPFVASSFDAVWACASLLHLAKVDVLGALEEVRRVLKPGGVLCTSMQEGSAEGSITGDDDDALVGRYYSFYRAEEWIDLVERAGLELIEQRLVRSREHVNAGATGWIETFARKPA